MVDLLEKYGGADFLDLRALKIFSQFCFDEGVKQGRADEIEEFAHTLKETFNNEFPSNYHCTQPYFTLDNVRVLIDCVVKEQKQ